jgi:hypothetical protein
MKYIKLICLVFLFGCYGSPPTDYGAALLRRVETSKFKTGSYPNTIEGNLADKKASDWKIKTNSFFYLVDSTHTFFTLKVFNSNGLADIYNSRTKRWVRTDK